MSTESVPFLTEKTRRVLAELLRHPFRERDAPEIGRPIGMAKHAVPPLLARLINLGWVTDRRGPQNRRFYRLVPESVADAQAALDTESEPSRVGRVHHPTLLPPTPAEADPGDPPAEVWTMKQLEDAVAAGRETPAFLALVRTKLRSGT